jgi:RNA polymerase sigma factor (sigma-70 family)
VLQEVLLEASQVFLEGRAGDSWDDESFFAWLSKIIENKIKNLARFHVSAQRRSVKREVPLEHDGTDQPRTAGKSPSAELVEREGSDDLRRAMDQLSPKEREVIQLVHFQKLRVMEAAERLGKTPNSTSVLLHHALKRLGEILKRRER